MRSAEEFHAVRQLIAAGMTDRQIEAETSVPRRTVQQWRNPPRKSRRESATHSCGTDHDFVPWTRPTKRTVAVYRKAATARLDEFVGLKC